MLPAKFEFDNLKNQQRDNCELEHRIVSLFETFFWQLHIFNQHHLMLVDILEYFIPKHSWYSVGIPVFNPPLLSDYFQM